MKNGKILDLLMLNMFLLNRLWLRAGLITPVRGYLNSVMLEVEKV